MFFTALAMVAFVFSPVLGANQTFLDNNPQLGQYQNARQCFPANANLYLQYRNYKSDPYFGNTSKCVVASQYDPVKKDSTKMTISYSGTKRQVKMTFISTPGYDVKNAVNMKYLDGAREEFNLTVAYIECTKCHILRSDYKDGGAGCMLWIPEDALDDDHTCCQFAYDLLCGTSPKYQIYEGCQ